MLRPMLGNFWVRRCCRMCDWGHNLMGGRGSVFGGILGAWMMESLNTAWSMENMEPYWQFIVKGLVLWSVWVDMHFQKE